jgi:uncharacterized protein YutE (UPF0331/DUF86 family)
MKRIQKNQKLLEYISSNEFKNKKLRQALINNIHKESIYSICECVKNVMNGNVKLDDKTFQILKPYKLTFKKLLNRQNDLNSKRKILVQKGGFLQFLIPAVISGIASIASAFISNKNKE